MDLSPFDFTGPLPPDRVHGRDDLLAELTERVTARSPAALLGPRRFGKTSVLDRLAADLTEAVCITIDLMPVQSAHDAVRALTTALLDTNPTVAKTATSVSATLGFNLVALRGQVRATRPADRPDPTVALANLIDTLVDTALRQPTVIIFDEFQQIAAVPNGSALLRSALQRHYKDIGLLFAGSAPSAMRNIFANHDQPFLRQASLIEIGPLDLPAVQHLIDDGFAATGRDPGTVASHIHQFTGGHPLATMRSAHHAWTHTGDGQPAHQTWGDALAAIRHYDHLEAAATYHELDATHQKTLRTVANHGRAYGAAAAVIDLGKSSAQSAVRALLADGHLLDAPDGGLTVTDPFLADWLRVTYRS